ncbi:hypothetical protein M0Q97_01620 [Candidatus Dojkabacteria bacterium]|jgi:hypothetical protein|nr:hypothetical protein [Candidatus Dojkabacteria bacterium]
MNFSIVIITKNDEENLPNLLNSLNDFKNNGDVFIVDFNSTDNTINIASEWGCKIEDGSMFLRNVDIDMSNIINEKFNGDNGIINTNDIYLDHSGVKNYAASLTTKNMVLILYANTKIIEFNINEIFDCINDGYDLIHFENPSIKIYDKNKYYWNNIIYEGLNLSSDQTPNDIYKQSIKIDNIDYKYFTNNTNETLIGILINSFIQNNIDNKLILTELINNNYINSAIKELNKQLSEINNIKKCKLMVEFGDLLINNNNIEIGLRYYYDAYLICSDMRLPLYKLGEYYFNNKMWDKSIFYLEGCLNIQKNDDIIDDIIYKEKPYAMLYVAWWWYGDVKKGKYYFDKTIELNPYNQLYIDEALFHYEYKSNNIVGNATFQQLQFLYNKSKKHKTILEIYPEARTTEALLAGTNNIVTVLKKSEDESYIKSLDYPGNLKTLYMTTNEAITYFEKENIKFDVIILYDYIESIPIYLGISIWEKFTNKLLCGFNYNENKKLIDDTFEITNVTENIWYKEISSFEKTIIYKKKY